MLVAGDGSGFMNKAALALPKRDAPGPSSGTTGSKARGKSHIRQARPSAPQVEVPKTGPMAEMLKKLLGGKD
jgi:PTH1 family peptidyl-tRNA hydrolase